MSPRLRYEGPGHRLEAFGKVVLRGDEATFTDDQIATLLTQRRIRFSMDGQLLTPPSEATRAASSDRPSVFGSRRQWSAYADTHGVTVTDDMTRDEIIAAIDAPPPGAGEPEDHSVEGQHTTQEEE